MNQTIIMIFLKTIGVFILLNAYNFQVVNGLQSTVTDQNSPRLKTSGDYQYPQCMCTCTCSVPQCPVPPVPWRTSPPTSQPTSYPSSFPTNAVPTKDLSTVPTAFPTTETLGAPTRKPTDSFSLSFSSVNSDELQPANRKLFGNEEEMDFSGLPDQSAPPDISNLW